MHGREGAHKRGFLSTRVAARRCNITLEVNHLTEGIKLGLQDDREKNSDALGRLALFKVRHQLGTIYLQKAIIPEGCSSALTVSTYCLHALLAVSLCSG